MADLIGNRWYRVVLLFYHRGLRCLVVIDLKIGTFNLADIEPVIDFYVSAP